MKTDSPLANTEMITSSFIHYSTLTCVLTQYKQTIVHNSFINLKFQNTMHFPKTFSLGNNLTMQHTIYTRPTASSQYSLIISKNLKTVTPILLKLSYLSLKNYNVKKNNIKYCKTKVLLCKLWQTATKQSHRLTKTENKI